jgi:hypothetical protein
MNKPSIYNVLSRLPIYADDDCENGGLEELARALGLAVPAEATQEELAHACTLAIEEKFGL